MSHGWLRRVAAALVMTAWTVGIALPAFGALHASDVIDLDCGDTLVGVPHPVTQLEPVHPAVGDGHCAICHLQRAARGAWLSAKGWQASTQQAALEAIAPDHVVPPAALHTLPSRAPPSVSSSLN